MENTKVNAHSNTAILDSLVKEEVLLNNLENLFLTILIPFPSRPSPEGSPVPSSCPEGRHAHEAEILNKR